MEYMGILLSVSQNDILPTKGELYIYIYIYGCTYNRMFMVHYCAKRMRDLPSRSARILQLLSKTLQVLNGGYGVAVSGNFGYDQE